MQVKKEVREKLGLMHIYCGDGKGKTTAAAGLALRALGNGLRVLVVQCLKEGESGEMRALKALGNVDVLALRGDFGFYFSMTEAQKEQCREQHDRNLEEAIARCRAGEVDLLVLDEMNCAFELDLVDRALLLDFLDNRPAHVEIVLTGRNPAGELLRRADYVSEIHKVKHPYDAGRGARAGIEE